MEVNKKAYEAYVKEMTPVNKKIPNIIKAFIVGGIICTIGQICTTLIMNQGAEKDTASAWTILILIAASVILTGLNIYPKITKFGGAGALVPITGFANSVVAPAVEFKAEGQVFGIGCKIFTIAGPVILYGILSSWLLGVIAYVLKAFGIV
ncbi:MULTISPECIES: SpoVA/SpoVAEb family sporulation membrane protein [Lacrimispora]|jgi:stage V sporulation protein AC|uniref:SpoVA/SpoVAEb family sporulation membrane protein n=1 Tax=Lacrimispora TaxID=2719231 RepID=UPI000BE355DC|nr:SpoVA/SpoVAEb family sporulation membrane protein [Lacrimispora amygdalina]MDK2964589.1 stage sporulation protein [Lacrimispora sp.]